MFWKSDLFSVGVLFASFFPSPGVPWGAFLVPKRLTDIRPIHFCDPWGSKVTPWVPKVAPGAPKVTPQALPGLKKEPFGVPK